MKSFNIPGFAALLFLTARAALAATVTYNWAVTWVEVNPDGEKVRPAIGINGQWPCPPIVANVGDTVVVNLVNQLGNETTSLHFHGLFQQGTNFMDGPVGVNQCAIPPGGRFQYQFQVGDSLP
jgi:iron transport multicopper oxidase